GIEALSKGYRHRVGLAQALLHDPSVLILDEPTSGLEPNQIIEIRNLIKAFTANKTVIVSTHIMQEVQAMCDRVIVINKGNIVADDRLNSLLQNQGAHTRVVVEFEGHIDLDALSQVNGVTAVEQLDANRFRIHALPSV